ncbi:hypothetical protein DEU56DRAFT_944221 [Suillus clintonianus]|uniref:uncharacterized protein n=1 Tax=Suillus clintonianus TaxID=1904413 RepID=UPI001B86BA0C|nr:uncharacterized protein DEU56DRAFT_944221 [Suillus clintonianus]KAG2139295.1 hypothetical protein DEU56DRAFT_944221 [Suillus clintonianus]
MAYPQLYDPYNPGFQHEEPDSEFAELTENSPFNVAVVLCPNCKKQYQSAEAIIEHLNSADSCWPENLTNRSMLPVLQALQRPPEQTNLSAKYHPTSGYHYILPDQPPAQNMFQEMQDHPLQEARETNVWYPFDGLGEWSLAKFLVENLSQTQIDKFLKLDWFQMRERPQFKTKDELFFYMQQLPGRGPKWQCTKLKLKGYESEQPIHLIWRDRLEVTKQLFANPVYAKHMCYDPHHIYQGQERQIGEFWTSDDAWEIQDQLPEGATIVPIIAASDKTPVTRHTGGLEMHPLFLTIGNIQADVRMKATSHAWRCTAFMPIPTFIVNSDFQTLLQARLWHKCMDLVCSHLKVAARVGEYMVDPSAKICYCFTPLISHIADLPEQLMIACLCNRVDPWDLIVYVRESKKLHLSGVHLPYWRNWRCSNPARFLTPEILHTLHKFFFDHVLKWIKQIMGHELDVRFKSHHKRTGVRHFSGGVSHVNQMTGREHRDIQRTIVPTLWGIASPGFIRAVRAMIDFIYLAQNPLHTESSIASMTQALQDFHDHKQAILDAEARQGKSGAKDDFFIPKLELMQNFARVISHVGSLMQWTADVSERLLITHCKHPFERTSRQRDFVLQIARILDREESIRQFNLYTLLSSSVSTPGQDPLMNAVIMEDEEIASTETDPTFAWVSNANPAAQLRLQAPRPVRNHFLKGILSDNARIAFNVTVKADCNRLDASQLQSSYDITDFSHALHLYATRNGCTLSDQLLFNTWLKFRIQLFSAFHTCRIMPSQQIHAEPPSSNFPRGNCDAVLFNQRVDGRNDAIFQPTLPRGSRAQLPERLSQVLVYIQHFDFVVPGPEPSTGMWMVRRSYTRYSAQSERVIRRGSIIPLTDVTHVVEIIPVYQGPLGRDVNSGNSMETKSCTTRYQ